MPTVHEMMVTITKAPEHHVPSHVVRAVTALIALPVEHLKPRLIELVTKHGFGGFSPIGKMYFENVIWMLTQDD